MLKLLNFLLKKLDEVKKMGNKAQTANIMNLIVAIVLIVAAAIPVTLDVIANQSDTLTGTTKTIVDLIPLFLGIGALVVVARAVIGGT